MREPRMPTAAGCVVVEAARVDRTADRGVAFTVKRARPCEPLLVRLCAKRGGCAGVAPHPVDAPGVRRIPGPREPEAMPLDEVGPEPVAAGRDRRPDRELLPQLCAGVDGAVERRPDAVPHDRVLALIEPVIREEEAFLGAARPPRRRAGVRDNDGRLDERTGLHHPVLERPPARNEWAGRAHARTSVGRMTEPLLVRVARAEPVERTPVWFMRQAGRSLPEYRAIREQHSFFEVAQTPELCAEVTLQPVRRHDVDAAVLFADIMSPVLGMGIGVELVEGVGPVVERPVGSRADVEALRTTEPDARILEAIRIVRGELSEEKALVGFCGAPFTVAGYLVEGRPSRDFARTKSLMYGDPGTWHALMEVLAEQFGRYVAAQVEAGADVIQLFDSWVGALSVEDYEEFVQPYSARILDAVDAPTIHFGTGTTEGLLAALAAAGGDVVGVDWRLPLDAVPGDRAVQGNLDPAALLAPWERVEEQALRVLDAGESRSHIFNLGHGVLPQTDPDVLTRLTALVQERTVEARV